MIKSRLKSLVIIFALGCLAGSAMAESTNPKLRSRRTKYKVRIDSVPPGAAIYLDKKEYGIVGYTPWDGRIRSGSWKIIIEAKGHEPASKSIRVRRTRRLQKHTLTLVKKPSPGVLDVKADADPNSLGAQVWLDGQLQGTIPVTLTAKAGRHLVEIKKPGYDPFSQWVEVQDDQKININPMLKAVVKAQKGNVLVEADVQGAEVWIDGNKHADVTPTMIQGLTAGPHIVEVRKPPALPWRQTVQVEDTKTIKVSAQLKATMAQAGGSVRVWSNVEGAEVYLDGKKVAAAPADLKDIAAGDHVIELRAPGYNPKEKTVTVATGQAMMLKFELQAQVADNASLKVVSPIPEALVYIDGEKLGAVPQEKQVGVGEHYVVVEKEGYPKFEKKVRVEAGQSITVTAELKAVGGLRVLSTPTGANVILDGEPVGQTPLVREDVAIGEHEVKLQFEGYHEATGMVSIEGGKMTPFSRELEQVDTGPSPADLQNEQRSLTSFGARVLPRGRTTIDLSVGYPYYAGVRFSVGAGKLAGHAFDTGFFARDIGNRWELGVSGRYNVVTHEPFAVAAFVNIGGGATFFGDDGRNSFFGDMGALASLTGIGAVTITGRAYLAMWSDRHCPKSTAGVFEGDAIDVCDDYVNGTLPIDERERIERIVGDDGPLGREAGIRAMVSIIVEIAIRQRWNIWAMFEGAPFQEQRAAFTNDFNGLMFDEDFNRYFSLGTTYKF